MTILDTNVISEVLKPSPSPGVVSWLARQEPLAVYLTAVTQAELLYGVEAMLAGKRKARLATALEKVFAEEFRGRILSFDGESARAFAKLVRKREAAGRPISQFDAMIAAIARTVGAALATRNTRDFEDCGIRVINPWNE